MRYIILTFLLLISSYLFSQDSNVKFSSLSINDGLSQSAVYTILQDSEGFMWFGTTEGLNKYDGNEFVHYKYELADSNSLSDNFVVSIIEASDNNIWIATRDGGIDIFNKKSENFERIRINNRDDLINNTTYIIFEDSKNNIWIGTARGIAKFNVKSRLFNFEINNSNPKHSLNETSITAFFEDNYSNIWIGTKTGELYKILDESREIIKILPQSNDTESLFQSRISSILQDKNNEDLLWFIGDQGLFKFDVLTNEITKLKIGTQKNIIFKKGVIDGDNNILIGSKNSGLFKFNTYDNSTVEFKHAPYDDNSISNNNILSFYIDNSDLLWIGTRGGGVNRLIYDNFYHLYHEETSNQEDLFNNNIWAIYEDSLDYLWVGTENGLNRIDKTTNNITHFHTNSKDNNSISNNLVFTFLEDKSKNFWIGTAGGLNLFDRKNGNFKHFKHDPKNPNSISNNQVKDLFCDSFGDFWIATRNGLNKFDYKNETFTHYKHNPDNNNSIISNSINSIYETSDGILWIGTNLGLEKFNREDNSFTHYTINPENSNSINDIHVFSLIEGPNNNLWIGTFNGGLNKFNYREEEFTHFTTEDGLTSNIIYSIEIDNNNNLWLSSNGALSKFSIKDHSIINYSTENGLNNMEFNLNSSYKNKDGKLFFGGINGIDCFEPEKFNPKIKHTSLHFTKLVLNNKITHDGKNMPIKKSITFDSEIILDYNEYPFSVHFSLLDFKYPKSNNYKYKIKELSNSWIDIGNENKISFTKLTPGKYTLEVQASNSFNLLNDTKSIDIIIIPPYWKKTWFIIIVFLLLFSFVISYILYREKKIKKDKKILGIKVKDRTLELENQKKELKTQIEFNQKQQERIKQQNSELELHKTNLEGLVEKRTADLEKAKNKAEESDRLKNSFLANISHEIRTPMNAIVGFSELLRETGNPSTEQLNMLNIITFNSNSLLNLISDIVDIAKLENNDISLNRNNIDINKLLNDLFETYNNDRELKLKKIELKLIQFPEPIILITDEVRVKQIFSKLLDNAIKYTDNGIIEFGYKIDKENNAIQFYVKDTGIGLSETQKDEIFKLFRKIETDKNKLYRGVGLGLTFCHKLVQMLMGEIWVESKENIGSTFNFTLPINTTSKIKSKQQRLIPDYNWKDKNILIAEDEINNYMFLEAAIKPSQANIFYAKNGKEAIEITNNAKNIDLIIMDVKMPDMDGLEATKIIRKTNKEIKIIAFTAYAMTNDEAIAIDYGCDDYISKPAKPQHIMKIINEHLN